MLEAINLMRFSKYGFLMALSAFLSFIANENPSIRLPLIYLWMAVVFFSVIACLWKTVEVIDDETKVQHLLTMFQKLEAIIITSLITFGVMMGLLR
jgi:hypothetical protein